MSQQTIEKLLICVLQRMEEQGLSQTALAARLGVSHSAISRYLSGKRPLTLGRLVRIAEVLEMPVASLLAEPEVREQPQVK